MSEALDHIDVKLDRKASFDRYVRKGDAAGSDSDGGYIVPLEETKWLRCSWT